MASLGFGAVAAGAASSGSLVGPSGKLAPAADDAAIYEYSYTTGISGVYQLAGAWGAHFPFSFEFDDGALVDIRVTDDSANTEISSATFNRAGNTLTVLKVFASTNGGALVNWSGRTRLLVHALVQGLALCPTPPLAGQVPTWDAVNGWYCPETPAPATPPFPLCATPPTVGQILVFDGTNYCPADLCALVVACLMPAAPGAVSFGGDAFGWTFP